MVWLPVAFTAVETQRGTGRGAVRCIEASRYARFAPVPGITLEIAMTGGKIAKALAAGLAATLVLSALMIMKSMMDIMPDLDLPKMIAGMMGAPDMPLIGWFVHFMIGIVIYGVAIAILDGGSSGKNSVIRGLLISTAGWLVMMVMLMPMAGAGFFGMMLGIMAPIMTLMLHLVFGAVLGWVYGRLMHGDRHPAAAQAS